MADFLMEFHLICVTVEIDNTSSFVVKIEKQIEKIVFNCIISRETIFEIYPLMFIQVEP